MIFTKEQFDGIGGLRSVDFNKLGIDCNNDESRLALFNNLPQHLQGLAVSWGTSDTVFESDLMEHLGCYEQ